VTTAETKAEPHIAFLKEAANYFRKLDTHGEDMAFWANATNAETCERIAATLASITAERDQLKADSLAANMLAHKWMVAHDSLKAGKPYDYPRTSDVPDIMAERDAMREALDRFLGARLKRDDGRHRGWLISGAGGINEAAMKADPAYAQEVAEWLATLGPKAPLPTGYVVGEVGAQAPEERG
jgi:hypothetical protein